ncbi:MULTISPECIES: hypothetical protein [Rhodococcus]|jgi:hypothetical protein|uniref:Uncharacterized protein n=2 Tax=Rhodococcus rhodochrous TaxID=1829 RepID=A0AA47AA91_RHORH|nr:MULTISPECIES: hypothetical protein [Rhodococcus]MBF4480388.1 hypothetical protein [Rhodococcus rhodochrous]MCB8911612.1 hypothetical protein [Rhodococcus rhodochrous]MDC3724471.1 hypothetical protein [Rhodococcus sp. Rp3]UZF45020.1 hypothetical protein KUM34_024895 [Rhodococcus rhodochrous]WSE22624.1 hypothetical protein U9J23_23750 [Rhodococcus sp. PD04]
MMPHRDPLSGDRWVFRCDHCDHCYRTVAQSRPQAELYARMNGWTTAPTMLCPGCATLFAGEIAPLAHVEG